jgi:hypothetical protein
MPYVAASATAFANNEALLLFSVGAKHGTHHWALAHLEAQASSLMGGMALNLDGTIAAPPSDKNNG